MDRGERQQEQYGHAKQVPSFIRLGEKQEGEKHVIRWKAVNLHILHINLRCIHIPWFLAPSLSPRPLTYPALQIALDLAPWPHRFFSRAKVRVAHFAGFVSIDFPLVCYL